MLGSVQGFALLLSKSYSQIFFFCKCSSANKLGDIFIYTAKKLSSLFYLVGLFLSTNTETFLNRHTFICEAKCSVLD